MRSSIITTAILLAFAARGFATEPQTASKDPSRVLPVGQLPKDVRLGKPRTLRDAYHPWAPPKTLAEWKVERQRLREQVLISQGLWPMPPKTSLKAVVHGKIDKGDYTVEKVFFQSHPGHYVTGNLYRPKASGAASAPRSPVVLCPHGHWANARFYDAGENNAKKLIAGGGETFMNAARHHIQARMVGLARLGCVVFHYDMVGYSDSRAIAHRQGFTDAEASLRLQNFMGLQTWNSIRALDFVTSLPDVDTKRIGITGASGGGTQTFMLAAIDPRISVAFPAVMVSTGMQGGCVCENAEYLRVGVNNIALAALFAPKPQAMSGADDWTVAIETKGYPELRQLYSLYGKPENISAKAFPQFKHNYNQVARQMMYEWFNAHLKLGHKSPIKERDFEPIAAKDLSVFNEKHPLPKNSKSAAQLRKYLTQVSNRQFTKLVPKSKEDVKRYRQVVGAAARIMFGGMPDIKQLGLKRKEFSKDAGTQIHRATVSRKGAGQEIPTVGLVPAGFNRTMAYWVDGHGKSHLFGANGHVKPDVQSLLKNGTAVLSLDVLKTGEFLKTGTAAKTNVNKSYIGFSYGYNHPLIASRTQDILNLVTTHGPMAKQFQLVGTGDAGPWVLMAAAQAGNRVNRVIVDLNGFSFRKMKSTSDANFLPGALKYGGIGGLAALAAPTELVVYGTKGIPKEELAPLIQMYQVTGGKLTLHEGKLTDELAAKEVLKK